jgi:hypothetical protein
MQMKNGSETLDTCWWKNLGNRFRQFITLYWQQQSTKFYRKIYKFGFKFLLVIKVKTTVIKNEAGKFLCVSLIMLS